MAGQLRVNAIEAGTTRIEYGIEWQGVAAKDVYRRTIADNGKGMTGDELVQFFNIFGGGGKPIGGEHENFGVGAKTGLMPWNHYGIVVISWADGVGSMIRIERDEHTGEYGLRPTSVHHDDEDIVELAAPLHYDAELDIDWRKIKPKWIDDHGRVLVLLE
jgi:hypothetical protein